MATPISDDDLYAPISDAELYAPISRRERGAPISDAPPTDDALYAPISNDELYAPISQGRGAPISPDAPPQAVKYAVPESEKGGILTGARGEGIITTDTISQIATSSGASPEYIREIAPWFSLIPAGEISAANMGRAGLGGVADVLSLTDIYKKFGVEDESHRRAMDALQDLRAGQRSRLGDITSIATSVVAGGALSRLGVAVGLRAGAALDLGATSTRVLGHALGLGGAAGGGAIASKEGDEGWGALIGAGAYVGLPAVVGAASKGWGAVTKKAAARVVDDIARAVPEDAVTAAYAKNSAGEEALARAVLKWAKKSPSERQIVKQLPEEDIAAIASLYKKPPPKTGKKSELDAAAEQLAGVADESEVVQQARAVISKTRGRLGRVMGVGGSKGGLDDALAREGEEFTTKRLQMIRRAEYLAEEIQKGPDALVLGHIGPMRRAYTFIADARYVYDGIDNRFGTELTPALDKLSAAYNASTIVTNSSLQQLKPVVAQFKKAEEKTLSGRPFREAAFDALDSGEWSPAEYTAKQLDTLKGLRTFFSDQADMVESLPQLFPHLGLSEMKIPRRLSGSAQSYVPHSTVPIPEMVGRIRARVDGQTPADLLAGDMDTLRGLSLYAGKKLDSEVEVADALNKLKLGVRTEDAVRSSARALFARQGEIPGFLMNRDVVDLAAKWVGSTYRHGFMRDGLAQMSSAADALAPVSPTLSQYVRNHVTDLMGTRTGTFSKMASDYGDSLRMRADEQLQKPGISAADKAKWTLIGGVPDMGRAMSGNVYAYYLGLNPASAARNMAQLAVMTAPSMSAQHAGDAVRRLIPAYGAAARSLLDGTARRALEKQGAVPSSQLFEAQRDLRDSLGRSPIGQWAQEKQDAAASIAMKLYETSDIVSRAGTAHIAAGVVRDAMQGAPAAVAHLTAVSPGYATALRRALRAGDRDTATRLYTQYLQGFTQFNYNRVSMSEFGRAMGPIFSMFSKWPTSIAGELGGYLDARAIGRPMQGDTGRVLWKYMAPLFLTGWAQGTNREGGWDEAADEHPAAKAVVGKDVRKWFPSDVLHQLADAASKKKVPVTLPPVVEGAVRAAGAAADSDPTGVGVALLDGALSGLPFSAYVRLLLETGPEMLGKEPIVKLKGRDLLDSDD